LDLSKSVSEQKPKGEADLSSLLVNTLDRFAKPMYEFTYKEEKKGSECWWMLL
jgi:hypothetical protein